MSNINLFLALAMVSALVSSPPQDTRQKISMAYQGDRTTPLRAITALALANGIPVGIIFGPRPSLCNREEYFKFNGMSPLQALNKAVEGTGYKVTVRDGVYDITAADLTQHETLVTQFRFPRFEAPPTTMADLGARLSGYVLLSIEGARGFAINSIGNPADEVVHISKLEGVTGPEVANAVVILGSKGLWTMQSTYIGDKAKRENTTFRIYSYHDAPDSLRRLSCPIRHSHRHELKR